MITMGQQLMQPIRPTAEEILLLMIMEQVLTTLLQEELTVVPVIVLIFPVVMPLMVDQVILAVLVQLL